MVVDFSVVYIVVDIVDGHIVDVVVVVVDDVDGDIVVVVNVVVGGGVGVVFGGVGVVVGYGFDDFMLFKICVGVVVVDHGFRGVVVMLLLML